MSLQHNPRMTNLYTPMSLALQAHWKTHNNAYPQKFVLTDSALTTLNQVRKLVNESIASPLQSGWEREFMGVPLEIGPANAMVGLDGTETPL